MEREFFLVAPEKYFYELSTLVREHRPLVRVIPEKKEGVEGILLSEDLKSACLIDEKGTILVEKTMEDPFEDYVGETQKNRAKVLIASVFGNKVPWGILTGVRPSKVAYHYQEQGKSAEETAEILEEHYLLRKDKAELCSSVAKAERELMKDQKGEDISIYAGVLFCPTRCSYCSFISNDKRAYDRYAMDYVDAMIREMEEVSKSIRGRKIRSFYMGGGTPTTLDAASLKRILTKADELFDFSKMQEITVEAGRPDTITREKLEVLKECGVDRISINPQTMNQKTLDLIGRSHSVEAVEEAFLLAREVGIDNINMDLIVGLPEETEEDVQRTMEKIAPLHPDNVTVHTLAVKRSSRMNEMGEGEEMLTKDIEALQNKIDAMIGITAKFCKEWGMEPYYMYRQKNMAGNFENVGYALPRKEGRYNIEIMEERQSILAFGAGGVSKVYFPEENRLERVPNVKGVKEYIERLDEMIERKRKAFSEECSSEKE